MIKTYFSFLTFFFCILLSLSAVNAQTTAFTYQGRLTDSSMPANGTYTLKFRLYGSLDQNDQIGSEQTALVTVSNGIFTIKLDFGSNSFAPNADRWLEIQVGNTTLSPRQQLTSAPFAIRSIDSNKADALSANCNPCVTSDQIISLDGSKVTGTVADATNAATANTATTAGNVTGVVQTNNGGTGLSSSGGSGNFLKSNGSTWTSVPLSSTDIPAGSGNYIRNTTTQQTASFNVSGSGTLGGAFSANTVTSTSTSNLIFTGQSSSTVGTWLRLNNTSTGGNSWNIISTGSGNGEGAGKLLFNNQTSGGTRMQMDDTGVTFAGNGAFTGNLNVSGNLSFGALSGTIATSNFPTLPHCKARQTAAQTFSSGTTINVRFDGTQFCSGVTFDNSNDRLIIITPGLYQITAEILFLANSNGFRYMEINSSNGGEVAAASINAVNGFTTQMNVSGLVRLNAGDVLALAAAQTSGGNLDTEIFNNRAASMTVNWVGP